MRKVLAGNSYRTLYRVREGVPYPYRVFLISKASLSTLI